MVTIIKIKGTAATVSKENREDNTEEITNKVRQILLGKPKAFAQKRLINAYPKLQTIKIKVKEKIEKTKEEIDKKKEILDEKIDKKKKEIDNKIKSIDKKNKKKE